MFSIFLNFQKLVERRLDKKILTMQTDWGGEYQKLNTFFQKIGISHHVSCPHAHQQNGSAERKHRHIVEVGLSLLAQASMPLKFWDEAFLTATYLINIVPSKVINYQTPVERLFSTKPDYSFLRIFRCACWPHLRPYNSRKLEFRSKQCTFLGYSPQHKGNKCLEISTGRVYISRDVVFDESVFPFKNLHPNAGARLCQEILLPPTLTNLKIPGDEIVGADQLTNDHTNHASGSFESGVQVTQSSENGAESNAENEENSGYNGPLELARLGRPPVLHAWGVSPTSARHLACQGPLPMLQPIFLQNAAAHLDSGAVDLLALLTCTIPKNRDLLCMFLLCNLSSNMFKLGFQKGIVQPKKLYPGMIRYGNFSATGEPQSLSEALGDANWRCAMNQEYMALQKNQTWHLVPPPPGKNIIDCKWVFCIKRKADGPLIGIRLALLRKDSNNAMGSIMKILSALL